MELYVADYRAPVPDMRRRLLLAALALGIVARLVLVFLPTAFGVDMATWRGWGAILVDRPFDEFYTGASDLARDHLPGDLLLLALGARLHHALGLGPDGYEAMIKLVGVVADLVVALLLHRIVRRQRDDATADRVALWYLLCPAPFFISCVWGQWDAVSIALLLAAALFALREDRTWAAAVPLAAWAVLVKPQLAVVALLLAALVVRRQWRARRAGAVSAGALAAGWIAGTGAAAALVVGLARIFGLALWATDRPSLRTVLDEGLNLYPYTTNTAANLWQVVQVRLARTPDGDPVVGPLTYSTVGSLLFVALLVVALVGFGRLRRAGVDELAAWCWATALAMTAAYGVLTRVHERYLVPGLVLMLLTAALHRDRRLAACFWVASVALTANLVVVIVAFRPVAPLTALTLPFLVVSLVQVAVLVTWAVWPWTRAGRMTLVPVATR